MASVPYLTPDDLKGEPTLARLTTVDDDAIAGYVAEFEAVAEAFVGVALTPRDATDSLSVTSTRSIMLSHRPVRSVTSLTLDGYATTGFTVNASAGIIYIDARCGRSDVVAVYSHGLDTPPPAALRACRQYVRATALRDQQAVERDVVAQGFEGGGYTRFATPDAGDHPTGFIEVDRLLVSLRAEYRPILVA